MRGLTFEKPKKRYSLSECYANFLTILRIYRTTMNDNKKTVNAVLPIKERRVAPISPFI